MDERRGVGRPTKYDPAYAERMREYFDVPVRDAEGNASDFPTYAGFARSIGVGYSTLFAWAQEHAEFREAWEAVKAVQEDLLLKHGLKGDYNSRFATFITTNLFKDRYKDKQDVEVKADASICFKMDTCGLSAEDVTG